LKQVVLDASVAIKWAVPMAREPLTDEALHLLTRYVRGEIDFIVPDVFWAEIANVLWKGARQGRWSRDQAESVAAEMISREFMTVSSRALMPAALRIALVHDRSVYDCLYVALAEENGMQMITADERLANALAARLPVKWLGAWNL
jgi:predicted nucleic acid-binding protein